MKLHRGISLAETILTAGLLGMVLFTIGDLMAMAYRAHGRGTAQVVSYREAAVTLEQMARDLRCCTKVLWPTPGLWTANTGYTPNRAEPFTFDFNASGTSIVAQYWLDDRAHEVRRLLLRSSGFSLREARTHVLHGGETAAGRRMAAAVKRFEVTRLDPSANSGVLFIGALIEVGERLGQQTELLHGKLTSATRVLGL